MPKKMKLITALLWLTLTIPVLIGLGGVYALDHKDIVGGIVALVCSAAMTTIIVCYLWTIYLFYRSPYYPENVQEDFLETFLIGFLYCGVIVSIASMLFGVFAPSNDPLVAVSQIVSVPMLLASLYLLWGYLIPRSKNLR